MSATEMKQGNPLQRFDLELQRSHEPMKPNTGLDDAGGSTDIEKSFDLVVQ